ncbi:MAG: hypothetical protein NT094_00300, partial [Candidatus Staskawiczbacteria bacterium]|nr:hypothetical protein [Candidatus Staskawiczbacteria bacterium]
AFFAISPDGLTVFNSLFPNKILKPLQKFHQKIHFLKQKEISNFWRISSQIVIVTISIVLLKF